VLSVEGFHLGQHVVYTFLCTIVPRWLNHACVNLLSIWGHVVERRVICTVEPHTIWLFWALNFLGFLGAIAFNYVNAAYASSVAETGIGLCNRFVYSVCLPKMRHFGFGLADPNRNRNQSRKKLYQEKNCTNFFVSVFYFSP
jgi:hypothetical protein